MPTRQEVAQLAIGQQSKMLSRIALNDFGSKIVKSLGAPKSKIEDMEKLARYEHKPSKLESKGESANFVFSKAVNFDNLPAKAQRNQKQKIVAQIFDDKYIAENYYRGFQDNEGILYEKDGLVSKMK